MFAFGSKFSVYEYPAFFKASLNMDATLSNIFSFEERVDILLFKATGIFFRIV